MNLAVGPPEVGDNLQDKPQLAFFQQRKFAKVREYYLLVAANQPNLKKASGEHYLFSLPDGVEINLETDRYFQLDQDTIAVVCLKDGRTTQYFGKLVNKETSSEMLRMDNEIMAIIRRTKSETGNLPQKEVVIAHTAATREQVLKALPPPLAQSFAAAPPTMPRFIHLTPWPAAAIFPRLGRESEEEYQARLSHILAPEEFCVAQQALYATSNYLPFEELKTPENVAFFLHKFGIDFQENLLRPAQLALNLRAHILFLSYCQGLAPERQKAIQSIIQSYQGQTAAFLQAFEACEADLSLGDDIVAIAQRPDAEEIFTQHNALLAAREDVLKGRDKIAANLNPKGDGITDLKILQHLDYLDQPKFYSIILKKSAELLQQAAAGTSIETLQQNFKLSEILALALFSCLMPKNANEIAAAIEDIETVLEEVGIAVLKGYPSIIKSPDNMDDPENYPNPHTFSLADYQTIKGFLTAAYQEIDPGWLDYLIGNIARDIANPDVRFVLIRKAGKLISTFKVNQRTGYIGTQYVDRSLQKTYQLGEFAQIIGLAHLSPDTPAFGSVAVSNPAAERQVGLYGIGTDLITEGDSKELIRVTWNVPAAYLTKNRHQYSEQKIIELSQKKNDPSENIAAYKLDSTASNNAEFIKTLRTHFAQGYVLTRIFYARDPVGKIDLRQTYVVFERLTSR